MSSALTSKTQVMNSALRKLGAESITSASDNSNRARLVSASYEIQLEKLLTAHPWNKAIDYVELAAIDPTPGDVYDYSYAFQLPSDCLRVLNTSAGSRECWEEVSEGRLLADVSEITVKYVKKVEDVSALGAQFCEALAWAIAFDLAYSFTQSASMVQLCKDEAEKAVRAARSYDAQVGSVKVVEANDWLDARHY